MKRLLPPLTLLALAFGTAAAQTPTPTPTPVPPVFRALGFKTDGTLNAASGSISRGDPAFGGQQTASTVSGLGPLATASPTGTASSATFLRGDNSWQAPPSGGATLPSTTSLLKGNGSGGATAATPGTDYANGASGALANTALQPAGDASALTAAANRDLTPFNNGGYNIACWGDSLTFGSGGTPYPTQLSALLGTRHIDNFGFAGATTAYILASEFQVHPERTRGLNLIWAGRNDLGVNSNTTILANIASMVALIPAPKNYAILSVINASAEPSGSTNYNQIVALNAALASTYGTHYLDVRSYLVSQYNPALSGDVSAHAADEIPPSLQYSDGLHLNSAGYLAVATFLANNASAWGAGQALVTNAGVGNILAAGPQVGSALRPALGYFDSLGVGISSMLGTTIAPTAPFQAVKPATSPGTAMKVSSPNYGTGDVTLLEWTSEAGLDVGAAYRNAAIGSITQSGGGGDLVFYTAPTPTGGYTDRLHLQRDGGALFSGPDGNGNTLLATGNAQLTTSSGAYPSTLTLGTTGFGTTGAGFTMNFVGTKSGAVNGTLAGMGYYGVSNVLAWKVGGTLATGSTVDSGAQMTLSPTGLTLGGIETLAPQSSTPTTPSSGVTIYVDSSGNLHALHATGTNHVLSAP